MGKVDIKDVPVSLPKDRDPLNEAMWGALNAVAAQHCLVDWIRKTGSSEDEYAPSLEEVAEMFAGMAERIDTHLNRLKGFVFQSKGGVKP